MCTSGIKKQKFLEFEDLDLIAFSFQAFALDERTVDAAAADALRGWLAPGGVLVLATTGAVAELPGYRTIDTARYAKSGASWRPASSGELTVGILEAA